MGWHTRKVSAFEQDLPFLGLDEAHNRTQQGRFARAISAYHGDDVSFIQISVYASENRYSDDVGADVGKVDQDVVFHSPSTSRWMSGLLSTLAGLPSAATAPLIQAATRVA